jgi:hypothetical protein
VRAPAAAVVEGRTGVLVGAMVVSSGSNG